MMLGQHKGALLQFSGGKDSTALLYLARPYLDRVSVVFIETGATFPHVVRHIRETCERLKASLRVIRPVVPVQKWIDTHGLPSDIVPVEATDEMVGVVHDEEPTRLQSYARCCGKMLWEPMRRHISETGATLVLRGAKSADSRGFPRRRFSLDGAEYDHPLWDWSDDDVYAFLKAEGATLPNHYPAINDSLDCWLCTAHLKRHGDEKIKYIRDRYPELWPEVQGRVRKVQQTLDSQRARLDAAFAEVR